MVNAPVARPAQALYTPVRAWAKYDPKYTPHNLYRLRKVLQSGFKPEPWFKRDILKSAIFYTASQKRDITPLAFELLGKSPVRIPNTALIDLVKLQRHFQNDQLVACVWNYLTGGGFDKNPNLNIQELPVPLLLAFLRYFGPKRKFRHLALRIAADLADSPHIDAPLVALAVTRTRISCKDYAGAAQIASKVKLIDRPLAGALLVAYAALGDSENSEKMMNTIGGNLKAIELSGLVKNMACKDVRQACDFLASSDAIDDNTKQLAFYQLLNQAIANSDAELFDEYIDRLQNTVRHSEGMLMGLKIKWQVHHGTFDKAKLEYQLKVHKVHVMHQVNGFRQLKQFSNRLDKETERVEEGVDEGVEQGVEENSHPQASTDTAPDPPASDPPTPDLSAPSPPSPSQLRKAWLENEEKRFKINWEDLTSL